LGAARRRRDFDQSLPLPDSGSFILTDSFPVFRRILVSSNPFPNVLPGGDALADTRPDAQQDRARSWRRRAIAWFPLGLVAAFLALFALVLGDRLRPGRTLPIATVVTLRAETGARATAAEKANPYEAPLRFQASGWIEPDPLPIKATALVDGVVDRVHVLEGERVEKGQLLATLIDDDVRLDLETARSQLESLQAQAAAHESHIEVTEAEIATLRKQVAAAEAKRAELADEARRLRNLPAGSVPERDVTQARLALETQNAEIAARESQEEELRGRLRQLRDQARDFKARIGEARTEVARRQLALDRTRIVSPVDGVILSLLAVPGQKRILRMEGSDTATIAILYEPERLQARIDVPLAEAAQLTNGQPVRIRSNFLPDRVFRGTVTRIVGEADLQRNTLQAKVRIEDPDPRLRPEMLCRGEFLSLSSPGDAMQTSGNAASAGGGRVRVFVPQSALTEADETSAQVWVLDDSVGRLARRFVILGAERREDHRLALDGLKPGDRVVLDPPDDLKAGERVTPRS